MPSLRELYSLNQPAGIILWNAQLLNFQLGKFKVKHPGYQSYWLL